MTDTPPAPAPGKRVSWRDAGEIGSVLGMRILIVIGRLLGRSAVRLLLYPIVLYYLATTSPARRASREYLRRVTGAPRIPWTAIYRHMLRFAQCTVDRFLLVSGRTRGLVVTASGHEHLVRLQQEGRGALLLGAHLGSFEAMRAASTVANMRISIVADFRGARMISSLLERLAPGQADLVIPIGDGVDAMLRIKERIEAGEIVALLGDRAGPEERSLPATFLGGTARFPLGPYMLAAMLGCPVFLTFGIHRAPNRYELHCEPFADIISLPRRHRDPSLPGLVQRYASRLEHFCRMAPDNWFNFFAYWSTPS